MTWFNFLKRITTSGRFIPEIDGFRFVAISSVLVFHLGEQLHRYFSVSLPPLVDTLLQNGERGVRLFFVISGFILALPFARHRLLDDKAVSLKKYFLRRATRLEPPYIISLVLLAMLAVIAGHQSIVEVGEHLGASTLYLHNLIYVRPSSISVVTWSLEVEIQFYIFVPCLAMLFRIRNAGIRRSILIIAIFGLGAVQPLLLFEPRLQLSIANYLQFFLAGFLLADLFLLNSSTTRNAPASWDVVSLLGWPAIFLIPSRYTEIVGPFLIVAVYWAGFRGYIFKSLFSTPLLTTIGGMCYSIYLTHYALIALATRFSGHRHPLAMVAISVCLIALVSSAFFALIERPCMRPDWTNIVLIRLRGSRILSWIVRPERNNGVARLTATADPVGPSSLTLDRSDY